MKKNVFFLFFVVGAVGAGWWWYMQGGYLPHPTLGQLGQISRNVADTVTEAAANVSAPPPLRATEESPTAKLTNAGTLTWTNMARRDNGGLKTLTLNAKLSAAAEAKVDDMFANQYFAHESPSGAGPDDLADHVSYAYISIGENLALGNFADDQTLVQAWMDSPGHRANILGNYDEIGIAVRRGTYEGRTTWLAVQEFGRPLSACTQPNPSLKAKIDANKAQLAQLAAKADALRAEIESSKKLRTKEQVNAYNAKVAEYNALVKQLEALSQQIQGEVTVYNGQAQAFNACAKG